MYMSMAQYNAIIVLKFNHVSKSQTPPIPIPPLPTRHHPLPAPHVFLIYFCDGSLICWLYSTRANDTMVHIQSCSLTYSVCAVQDYVWETLNEAIGWYIIHCMYLCSIDLFTIDYWLLLCQTMIMIDNLCQWRSEIATGPLFTKTKYVVLRV